MSQPCGTCRHWKRLGAWWIDRPFCSCMGSRNCGDLRRADAPACAQWKEKP